MLAVSTGSWCSAVVAWLAEFTHISGHVGHVFVVAPNTKGGIVGLKLLNRRGLSFFFNTHGYQCVVGFGQLHTPTFW